MNPRHQIREKVEYDCLVKSEKYSNTKSLNILHKYMLNFIKNLSQIFSIKILLAVRKKTALYLKKKKIA